MNRITRFIIQYAFAILAIGFLLSTLGAYFSVHLFSNLRTEIEELLPTDARSVLDLNEVKSRLESTNNLSVIFFSENTQESKKWVDTFAKEIEKLPSTLSAGTEYRIDHVLDFFNQRKSLFIEESDLKKISNFIEEKLHYEIQLYNPLTIIANKSMVEPKLDLMAIQKKYTGKADSYSHFPDGYYATSDEKIRVVLVNLPGGATGIDGSKKLRHAVDEIITRLNPKKIIPDLKIAFTGGVQDLIEEHEALIEDLALSTALVSLLVSIAMILYFKTFLGTLALILSLLIGTVWTFGVSFFEVGYLNANSAFMGSIVLGNGINFGIILLARFLEERRKHKGAPRSLAIAMDKTFSATVVAAGAAGLAYGSLMLTSFRGFRQFGMIGLTGMALCWIASYTILPALLITFYKLGAFQKIAKPSKGKLITAIAYFVEHFPKSILLFTFLLTTLSLFTLSRINSDLIETDMRKLRNKNSLLHGSMYWSQFVDQVFQRYLSPVVILPQNQKDVKPIADEVRKVKEAEGKDSFIVNVSTIDDFIPADQAKKIHLLRQMRKMLPQSLLSELPQSQQKLANNLLSDQSFKSFTEGELPELVKSKFRERSGVMGNLILVEPSLSPELAKSNHLIHFVHSVREAADRIHPGTAVAGTLPVTADLFESIVRDGPKATLCAFIAVFLLVVILFRDFFTILQCSFALILGVLWLVGFILGFHYKINFLNFIALPITFGIGVDYGVNIFQRYRNEKRKGILTVLKQTGGAVMLASLTTIIGYGSLIIASNQAFVSFGTLAILGEITCVFAAVVSLPALICYLEKKAKKHEIATQH